MVKDLTSGKPLPLIIAFSVPLLISNLFQMLYNWADSLIVGRTLGEGPFAAVGSTGAVMFGVLGFLWGMTNGLGIITSQRFGAKDLDGVRRSVTHGTYIAAVTSLLFTGLCLWITPGLLRLMNTPADIYQDALIYLQVINMGLCSAIFYNLTSAILRAIGDSKSPLFFLIFSSIINIILDLVFILKFQMGVAGAAWATNVAQVISALGCVVYIHCRFPILHLRRQDWLLDRKMLFAQLRQSFPMALQFSIIAVGSMFLQAAANNFGTRAVAGMVIALRVTQINVQPMIAIGLAMTTFTAQNFGAKLYDRINSGVHQTTLLNMSWCLVSGAMLLLWGDSFARLFLETPDAETIRYAKIFYTAETFCFPLLGILFIFRNTLQGIGKPVTALWSGILELIARSVMSPILPQLMGYIGLCFVSPIAWLSGVLLLCPAYYIWRRKIQK